MDENSIETAIQKYLNHCRFEKGLDFKTIKAYQIDLLQFYAYNQKEGNSYCKENLQAYIANLHGHYKIKSVKRKIASLKAFFNYLEYEVRILSLKYVSSSTNRFFSPAQFP